MVASSYKVTGKNSIRTPADYGPPCKNEPENAPKDHEYPGSNATGADVKEKPHKESVGASEFEKKCKTTGKGPTDAPDEEVYKPKDTKRPG